MSSLKILDNMSHKSLMDQNKAIIHDQLEGSGSCTELEICSYLIFDT